MPRQARTSAEVAAVRARILDEALDLFAETGWEGFSMRRLGERLGIAAKTVYNYFESQDALYLGLLTRGFEQLRGELTSAVGAVEDPWRQLDALADAYVEFGFAKPNLYNLMFIWHVPKYDDYVGTSLEGAALVELGVALDSQRLLAATIEACAGRPVREEDLRFATLRAWTQLHGYVAGVNNHIVGYMHPDPAALRERMVASIKRSVVADVAALAGPDETARVPDAHGRTQS